METIAIEGVIRKEVGKRATNALRHEGMIPCELYGGKENVHFATTHNKVKDFIYTPNFHTAELQIDGKNYNAILKDIQFHPITDAIVHIDFLELVPGKVVQTEIPVKTVGVSEGAKIGGKLMLKKRKLIVKATPENLRSKIEIDVSNLQLGQSFKVGDIEDTGMEIITSPRIAVASIEIPRLLRAAEAEAAAAQEAEEALLLEEEAGEGATEEGADSATAEGGDAPAAE